jgi:hypothetical protein
MFGIDVANSYTLTLPPLWQAPAALALLGIAGALLYFSLLAGCVKVLRVRLR